MAQSVLIRKRGTIKAKLAHFEKFLNSVQPQDLARQTIFICKNGCTNSKPFLTASMKFSQKLNVNQIIQKHAMQKREDFETKFYLQLSRAKCLLESQSNLSNNIPHNNDDTKSQQSESDTQSISEQSVYTQGQATHVIQSQNDGFKLPDVDLPKFNGEYESWMEFRETFESMIHMIHSYTTYVSFTYLRASLAGDATV
ncbi:unnamed protein product [Acanthoscelides obtectus]|uniref:Uncharacterized protein n=1 Tax=Acanthoscelides obtectus TaxID=200917 RepID=A0A9P0VPN3_ACAOB|nr:unnamed protein product [Acanthoscelides obtectus]CAK1683468.1 hypothetical protein AOBTE_LOCUS34268 [Acanthoscelides obtectus]